MLMQKANNEQTGVSLDFGAMNERMLERLGRSDAFLRVQIEAFVQEVVEEVDLLDLCLGEAFGAPD